MRDLAPDMWANGSGLFAVEPRDGGPLVGSIGLFEPRDGYAEVGYWTAPGGRRHGFTADALRLLCEWAFDDLGLHRVELHVDPENTGSCGVAERAGFRAERVVRQRFLHRGQPSDVVLYALVATDRQPGALVRSAGHAADGQRLTRTEQGACCDW